MANEFFTILTATGRNKLAAATATATPLALTQMAVGDGDPATPGGAYYSPTEAQTTLKHEVWRGAINHLAVDANNPNWIVAELVIPDDVGGFYIREVGLFDSAGAMIAVGKFPESYKPTLAAGSNKQLYVRMILEVANTTAVTLLVDPSVVLATRQYCDDKIADELNKRDSKQSVRVATTAAIALTGLQTIDGVVLLAGDRVLVKDQAAGAENGIYVAAAGAWVRATDADSGTKLNAGALVPVEAGTANADTVWMLKTDGAIIVGATPIAFQWAGGLNAPTQAPGDNSAKIANTGFVQAAIAALVASSPAALDTLNELAAALGNDANFAASVTNALATKASQSGVQKQEYTAFTSTGAAGAYILTPNPAITAYSPGDRFRVKFHVAGNGADVINVSALGNKSLKQYDSAGTKVAPIIAAGQLVDVEYDGVDFVLLDPMPSPRGAQNFLASGNYTVPAGVTTVYLTGCGGGGGGGAYVNGTTGASGGGGAAACFKRAVAVTPGQVIAVTVGALGAGSQVQNTAGTAGGTTSFGALLSMGGGGAGAPATAGGGGGSISGGTGVGIGGQAGEQYNPILTSTAKGGDGGGSIFGQGGQGGGQGTSNVSGGNASGYGAGGGGGATGGGGYGSPGFLIVEW